MILIDTHIWLWWVSDPEHLPDGFRSDPADEILVATARLNGCALLTVDRKLRRYHHVITI